MDQRIEQETRQMTCLLYTTLYPAVFYMNYFKLIETTLGNISFKIS
ncbi:hypothetical protein Xedl_03656 [Xenorhabdus eapokensis]|uniref:Uncharacterized protein n=1 Tax=Xenorhabdus eapokensis TaxID=1873482 RepID=A0A1Q5TGP2_9GAMM|nr:hypothetical protein Xedl_03656 [Xenorhabdus eapokensis]